MVLVGAAWLGHLVEQAGREWDLQAGRAGKVVGARRVRPVHVDFSREASCCRAAHVLHGR